MAVDQAEAIEQGSTKAKREVEVITMADGRKVEFAGKRKMLKESFVDGHKASVRFDFRNGETRTFHVPHDMTAQFAAHGAMQKIGDETAGESDVDDAVVAVDNIMERLAKGEWNSRRSASGDSFAGSHVVIQALCEVSGKSKEEIKKYLDDKIESTEGLTRRALYASLRNPSSKVGQVIARLEEAKVKKEEKVHAEDLLSELNAM